MTISPKFLLLAAGIAVVSAAVMPAPVLADPAAPHLSSQAEPAGLQPAIALHDKARDGGMKEVTAALKVLEPLVEQNPDSAVARVYLGSVYAMKARSSLIPPAKLLYVKNAVDTLDQALEMAPGDFTVRMVRANVNSALPAVFARGDNGIEDMIALDKLFRQQPDAASARVMVGIYENLQQNAPDAGDWQSGLALAQQLNPQ